MKNDDFFDFMEPLFKFLAVQDEFLEEKERHEPHPLIKNQIGMTSLLVFVEGLALGIVWIAFWAVLEMFRRSYARIQRPKYYPQETARRRRLAAERRKIRRRRTLNPPPTAEELRAQYAKVRRNPREMIRFGSMLCDLEAYVDNGLVRDETGAITGRRPGIKGWLAEHCPEMRAHYKTVIRYKALAVKFRQAVGLADPHPAAEAVDDAPAVDKDETTVRKSVKSAIKEIAEAIFAEAGRSECGLREALDRRLDPDMAAESSAATPDCMPRKEQAVKLSDRMQRGNLTA